MPCQPTTFSLKAAVMEFWGTFRDVLGDVLDCFGGRSGMFLGTFSDVLGDALGAFLGTFGERIFLKVR